MNSKNSIIQKSFLQSGNSLPITQDISFKHPTIQEVFDIDKEHLGLYSEEIYYSMVNIFLTDPYQYMVYLDDRGIDYESTTPFKVFIMLFKDKMNLYESYLDNNPNSNTHIMEDIYFKAFNFFFGIDSFYPVEIKDGEWILVHDGKAFVDEKIYNYIFEFIKAINGIQDVEKINPEDEWAKQILIEDERERIKKLSKKKKDSEENTNRNRIGNLLSAITWSCNGGITPFNRNGLHMYDLIDGLNRTDKLLNYKNTMVGLYSGCVEKKKIDFKELHWSS